MELNHRSVSEYIAPHYIAEIYLALGHINQACDWLERAAAEHNPLLVGLGAARHYEPFTTKPAFARSCAE